MGALSRNWKTQDLLRACIRNETETSTVRNKIRSSRSTRSKRSSRLGREEGCLPRYRHAFELDVSVELLTFGRLERFEQLEQYFMERHASGAPATRRQPIHPWRVRCRRRALLKVSCR